MLLQKEFTHTSETVVELSNDTFVALLDPQKHLPNGLLRGPLKKCKINLLRYCMAELNVHKMRIYIEWSFVLLRRHDTRWLLPVRHDATFDSTDANEYTTNNASSKALLFLMCRRSLRKHRIAMLLGNNPACSLPARCVSRFGAV